VVLSEQMKLDICDHPAFFAVHRALWEGVSGLNAAIEDPAIGSLLPDLPGVCLLDQGFKDRPDGV
jgi:hypothetical protein